MKKTILLFAGILCSFGLAAQISEGGTPPSFEYPSFLRSGQFDKNVLTVPFNYDLNELRKEDQLDREIVAPLRVAVPVETSIDINETGMWSTLPNGLTIWQQTLELVGAVGAIISYEDFYIPAGGKLFIYNEDKSQVLGAYTNQTNPKGGRFSTQMIMGEKFTMEYVASQVSDDQPRINIQRIGYIYSKTNVNELADDLRGTTPPSLTPNASGRCMVNINCSDGDNWQDQKRGVALLLIEFPYNFTNESGNQQYLGWYGCTGSLINNTRNDGKPLMLSADHCFYKYLDKTYEADYATTQFYFKYEFPTCENGTGMPAGREVLIGSQLRARLPLITRSDGILVELNNKVPNSWNPYYNGWDASNDTPTSGVLIHHPHTDVKKITTYNQSPWRIQYEGTPAQSFWRIVYSKSVSEQGSSGSPLFNQKGLIVGTLTGGSSYCSPESAQKDPDDFGRMWYHYNQSPVAAERMSRYLNPDNLNIVSLAGYDPNGGGSGISAEEEANINIWLFPNPMVDEVNINAAGLIQSVRIYDVFGRLVYTIRDDKSSTANLNVSDWATGVYMFIIKTEQGEFVEKVMKK